MHTRAFHRDSCVCSKTTFFTVPYQKNERDENRICITLHTSRDPLSSRAIVLVWKDLHFPVLKNLVRNFFKRFFFFFILSNLVNKYQQNSPGRTARKRNSIVLAQVHVPARTWTRIQLHYVYYRDW